MKKFLILLFLSVGLSQTTFTDEEVINLENDFIYLENMYFQTDFLSGIDCEIFLLISKTSTFLRRR